MIECHNCAGQFEESELTFLVLTPVVHQKRPKGVCFVLVLHRVFLRHYLNWMAFCSKLIGPLTCCCCHVLFLVLLGIYNPPQQANL